MKRVLFSKDYHHNLTARVGTFFRAGLAIELDNETAEAAIAAGCAKLVRGSKSIKSKDNPDFVNALDKLVIPEKSVPDEADVDGDDPDEGDE